MIVHDERANIGRLATFELGTRNTDYKDCSWARLKAAAKKETGTRRPRLEVYAKPALGGKWIEGLYQEFGLDDVSALRYAKSLINEGEADSVWVAVFYYRFHSEDPRPKSYTLFNLEKEGIA